MKCALTVAALVVCLGLVGDVVAAECPADSVQSGTVCMDKDQASVWLVAPSERGLINKIRKGTATLANLQSAGAVQLGLAFGDLAANGCPGTGTAASTSMPSLSLG